ncbi:MAG TPA: iron-containing alcohol dehydrogenase [Afifellaceae bacterium]|nr:iron-containing alcohol dehydrogenase [Afifellaceae bacterium]
MATLSYFNTCFFDFGAVARLSKAMASLGIEHPLLVTDKGVRQAGLADIVLEKTGDPGRVEIFDGTPANPTERAVLDAARQCRESDCDGIIALGGGSAIDLAKATALMACSDEPLLHYAGLARGKVKQVLPLIAVPTTAGTGSEVSVGMIIIVEDGRKLTFVADQFIPAIAICDPELTAGMPAGLTAATGMDAVTHCIEAVLSPVVNPPAEAIGLDGLERAIAGGALEVAVANGSDRQARWHMMMASTEGAYAFVKGLGAVHAMSHACGALPGLQLHHGTLNAVLLPTILRFNAGAADEKMQRIARAMGLGSGGEIADFISGLNQRVGLPASLAAMGVIEGHIDGLAEAAAADMASQTNPRPVESSDYVSLFSEALDIS